MQRAFRLFAVFALAVSMIALTSPAQAATPTACNGVPASITGTPEDDVITGTPGDDVILGLGGNDIIDGGGGNDIICGGPGDDTITGGDGNDVAYGAAGNDDLAGGDGEDELFGGADDDTLRGNQDDDTLVGGPGSDLLNGGFGDDTMRGNDGNDRFFAGPGKDYAEGGPGSDSLSGSDDNDDLRGNGGDDTLNGEAGDDHLYGGADSDTSNGGSGFDRCMGTEFPTDCEDDDLNDPPVAIGDEFLTDEDTTTGGSVLADNGNGEDYDPNGHSLAVVAVEGDEAEVGQPLTLPSGAEIMVNADGSFSYDPSGVYEHFNGGDFAVDTFDYTISDPKGETDTATVAVRVDGVNDAPEAVDDEAATNEDESAAIDVLDNDTDIDSMIEIVTFSDPANGEVEFGDDDDLVYTPDKDFSGVDTFTYMITDGEFESTATVTVTVGPVNDLPVAEDDSEITTDEDTPVWIDVLANDSDVEDDATDLTITIVDGPANGSAALAEGGVEYTPAPDYYGPDSFTYEVTDTDGGTSAKVATVEIEVLPINDAPEAVDDDFHFGEHEFDGFGEEDEFFEGNLFDDNGNGPDSDVDGDELRVVAVNGQTLIEDDGFAWYEGELLVGYFAVEDDGFLFFVSTLDGFLPVGSSVSDTFEYTISDGEFESTATVTITIHGENDDPFASDDGPYPTDEETAIVIDGLTSNDDDIDIGDRLFVSDVNPVEETEGSVQLNPDGSVTYDPVGGLDFVPAGEVYRDVFEYTVSDQYGGTDTALVFVDVLGINDTPEAMDDTPTTDEETPVDIDVLANDEDADNGAVLDVIALDFDTTLGTVTILPSNEVRYEPPADFFGEDSFSYTMQDEFGAESSATVTVTVEPVNDLPEAFDDEAETLEDTPVTIDVTANDNDVEDDSADLTPVILDGPFVGTAEVVDGQIEYTPAPDYWGWDELVYFVIDTEGGESNLAFVEIWVEPVNDGPEAVDDEYEATEDEPAWLPVLENDSDIDSPFWIDSFTQPTNGSVAIDEGQDIDRPRLEEIGGGAFTYSPNPDFFGVDTFEYTITDGEFFSTATVFITVAGVNDLPEAVDDLGISTDEDTPVTIDVTANDNDVEDDSADLTPAVVDGPGNGSVEVVDGEIVYTPNPDYNGPDSFIYVVTDLDGGTSKSAATVSIDVLPVNDAPIAKDDSGEGFRLPTGQDSFVTASVLDNDYDIDEGTLEVAGIDVVGTVGTVTPGPGGTFTYLNSGALPPGAEDSWDYRVIDGEGGESWATVTIRINTVPEAGSDSIDANEDDGEVAGSLLGNDSDGDGDELLVTPIDQVLTDGPLTIGRIVVGSDGGYTLTLDESLQALNDGESADAIFSYEVADGFGGIAMANVVVSVEGETDLDAIDDAFTGWADVAGPRTQVGDVTDNDAGTGLVVTHVNGDPIDEGIGFGVTDGNAGEAIIWVFDNGRVDLEVIVPFAPDVLESFTYTVADGTGATDTASVDLTIYGYGDLAQDDTFFASGFEFGPIGNVLDNDVPGVTITRANGEDMIGGVWFFVTEPDGPGAADVFVFDDGTVYLEVWAPFGSSVETGFWYTVEDALGRTDVAYATIVIGVD
jgi:VCBS repeat-containing protein